MIQSFPLNLEVAFVLPLTNSYDNNLSCMEVTKCAILTALLQQTGQVVVVSQQPTATTTTFYRGFRSTDHYLTLSIVVLIFCCLFGSVFTLFCTIPAIMSAMQVRKKKP